INTHDIEFAAEVSDRVGLFFGGTVVSLDTPERFFSLNSFYTTAASRMSRHLMHAAVTADAIVNNCFKQHKSSFKSNACYCNQDRLWKNILRSARKRD